MATKLSNHDLNFNNLLYLLEENGYILDVALEYDVLFCSVKGKGIRAGFCESNNNISYPCLNGKITADNEKCFNKWLTSPLKLDLPSNAQESKRLLVLLDRLGSEVGYEESNSYDYDENTYRY